MEKFSIQNTLIKICDLKNENKTYFCRLFRMSLDRIDVFIIYP